VQAEVDVIVGEEIEAVMLATVIRLSTCVMVMTPTVVYLPAQSHGAVPLVVLE